MRRSRWLAPWKDSLVKPAIYHCVSRVVDRRFVFGDTEREQSLGSVSGVSDYEKPREGTITMLTKHSEGE